MGSIKEYLKKDGTCSYQAEVRMKGHKPQRNSFRTRTQAKQWIQQTESAIRDGRYVNVGEAHRRTLNELIERFTSEWLPKNSKGEKNKQRFFHGGFKNTAIASLVM